MFQDQPRYSDCDNWRAQSNHRGGMNVTLADASVRVVHPGISQQTWTNALLPNDGQTLVLDPKEGTFAGACFPGLYKVVFAAVRVMDLEPLGGPEGTVGVAPFDLYTRNQPFYTNANITASSRASPAAWVL
jgi:hypothetical protein